MKRTIAIALSVLMCSSVFSFASCDDEPATEAPHVHDYASTVVNPTCTEKGYTKYVCACGDTYQANEVEATGHSYETEVIAPTCLADGYTKHTCECGDTYNDTTVAKNPENHTYETEVIAPTCTAQGYTLYTCECGATYKDTFTPTANHVFEDGRCDCGLTEAMIQALTFNEFETTAEVKACDTTFAGEMIIPSTYNGKPVTYISARAFNACNQITSVTIPEGVTALGEQSFGYCTSLTSVNFPSTIVEFGAYAFAGCTGMTTFEIPESLKIMKTSVFSSCTFDTASMAQYGNCYYLGNEANPYMVLYQMVVKNAEDYPIHEDATIIYDYAFSSATHDSFVQNKHIDLHDGITSIGDSAFNVGAHFFVDRVPSSLMHLGKGAFSNYNSGTGTNMGVQQSNGGWFMGNEENPYLILITPSNFDSDGTYTVNPNTKFIYDYAFSNAYTKVKSVVFHNDILEIGQHAFHNCYQMTNIILPEKLTELSQYLFYMDYTYQSYFSPGFIVFPKALKDINGYIFHDWVTIFAMKYFAGTRAEWSSIYIDSYWNTSYSAGSIYVYSEETPPLNEAQTGYNDIYWHYVDGTPTRWVYTAS